LAASCFAIFVFIMTPTIVQFVIEGNVVELTEIPNIYNSTDLVVLLAITVFHFTRIRAVQEFSKSKKAIK
jgi:hypothetical protein